MPMNRPRQPSPHSMNACSTTSVSPFDRKNDPPPPIRPAAPGNCRARRYRRSTTAPSHPASAWHRPATDREGSAGATRRSPAHARRAHRSRHPPRRPAMRDRGAHPANIASFAAPSPPARTRQSRNPAHGTPSPVTSSGNATPRMPLDVQRRPALRTPMSAGGQVQNRATGPAGLHAGHAGCGPHDPTLAAPRARPTVILVIDRHLYRQYRQNPVLPPCLALLGFFLVIS